MSINLPVHSFKNRLSLHQETIRKCPSHCETRCKLEYIVFFVIKTNYFIPRVNQIKCALKMHKTNTKPPNSIREYFSVHRELIMNKTVWMCIDSDNAMVMVKSIELCYVQQQQQQQNQQPERLPKSRVQLNVTRAHSEWVWAWSMNWTARHPTECVFSTLYLTQRNAAQKFSTLFAMVACVSEYGDRV